MNYKGWILNEICIVNELIWIKSKLIIYLNSPFIINFDFIHVYYLLDIAVKMTYYNSNLPHDGHILLYKDHWLLP